MVGEEIRLFYSWQSDLPNNETRCLIQDGIDSAVKSFKNIVPIIADRDTKGESGSPDISQMVFSKIDKCDIFIADISIVNKYHSINDNGEPKEDVKAGPNPNVLLELGYAVNVVGWENIICFMNTDYGKISDLPFDLQKHRVSPYSLMDATKSKADVKKYIQGIIEETVRNLLRNGIRVKNGFTNLSVGSYLFDKNEVSRKLMPFSPSDYFLSKIKKGMQEKCNNLIDIINKIHLEPREKCEIKENIISPLQANELHLFSPSSNTNQFVNIEKADKETIINYLKNNHNIVIDTEFFELGNLKYKQKWHLADNEQDFEGTDEEIDKYYKIMELLNCIIRMETMDMYAHTFDEYLLFPLAIQNKSTLKDENITISVFVLGNATAVVPSKSIISQDLKDLEGAIYEEDYIKELLFMREDSKIRYDEDISYSESDYLHNFKANGVNGMHFDEDDYEKELMKYIATPNGEDQYYYEFHIDSLRANECCWLGPLIVIKACSEDVEMRYSIKSDHSDGSLTGIISTKAD